VLTDTDHDRTLATLAGQVDDYARLSRRYAARGDSRRAALAAWTADVRAVQALLWEGGLAAARDPEQQLGAVAEAVETAMLVQELPSGLTARELVENAREALVAAFDDSVHALLAARFGPLDHLDGVPAPTAGAANEAVCERLDGRSGEHLVGALLVAAADARAVAQVMASAGDDEEARRQLASADLASFEAYLVLASAASGDATLATADLRWGLAASKVEEQPHENTHPQDVRAAILSTAVPAEEPALLSLLDQGPVPA
jgi:hypothetical protein